MNIETKRAFDRYLGAPLCRLLSAWPGARARAAIEATPKRILIVLLSEMGSLVLTQPMLRKLRERYPGAELYALVFRQNREVLDLLELVPTENVLTLRDSSLGSLLLDALSVLRKLRRLRIDVAIDGELFARVSAIICFLSGARLRVGFHPHHQEGLYRGSFWNRPVLYNPYQHISQQFLTLADAVETAGTGTSRPLVKRAVESTPLRLEPIALLDGEVDAMRERLGRDHPSVRGKRLVLLYPGGGLLPIRAWPLQSFSELAARFVRRGDAVGIVGLASDDGLARQVQSHVGGELCVNLTGYTRTVRELMVLFHLADVLVTNDGGPGHFASMTPLATILLFGPETPRLYGSLHPKAVHFYRNLSCSPCLTAYNHRSSPCDGDNQCLKQITVDEVAAAVDRLLSSEAPGDQQ
jgi:ADP-heptose:LPS heptosyltransferase